MDFFNPQYLTEAFEILDTRGHEVKICAGMTHVLRFYSEFPGELAQQFKGILHVGRLDALADCREEHRKYIVGATTRIAALAQDSFLARYAPAVIDAAQMTSTPQIRNRRTVGGEICWGSYHSPLITTLMTLEASLRIRFRGSSAKAGFEETVSIDEFYGAEQERTSSRGQKLTTRTPKTEKQNLLTKIMIPEEVLYRTGAFGFFRALVPKISTENSGVVLAVRGTQRNGTIEEVKMVASGTWMGTLKTSLPLEGVRMTDAYLFERLYNFCDRHNFDRYRRAGPSGNQLGLVVFGLLKEGFSQFLIR